MSFIVPDFKYNLLSVHKLSNHLYCNMLFTPCTCVLQDLYLKKEQVFGGVGDKSYLLKPFRMESQTYSSVVSTKVVSIPKEIIPILFPF